MAARMTGGPEIHFEEFLRGFGSSGDQFTAGSMRLDQKEISQLRQDTNEQTVMRILARFRETLDEVRRHSEEGLKMGEARRIWQACHKVAGSSDLLGFKEFGKLARRLSNGLRANEDLGKMGAEIELFVKEVSALSKKIDQSCPDLKEYVSS